MMLLELKEPIVIYVDRIYNKPGQLYYLYHLFRGHRARVF